MGIQAFAVLSDRNGRYRRVSPDLCKDSFGDVECEYGGEIVTMYTGEYTQSSIIGKSQSKAASYVPKKAMY